MILIEIPLCFFIVAGPRPGPPRNLTVTEISNGFLITWQHPLEKSHLIQYYDIKYKTDGPWKLLNKGQIRPEETSYLGKFIYSYFFFKVKNNFFHLIVIIFSLF